MVDTPILLGQNHSASSVADTGISDDVVVTLSRALAADELGLVGVLVMQHTGAPATPAVTGGGITWQLVDANPFRTLGNQATLFVFSGKSASPSGTSVTVSAGAPYRIAVAQVLGVANGSTSFVQVVPGSGATTSSVGVQVATMTDTTNNAFVAFGTYTRSTAAARTWVVDTAGGYTLLDSRAATDGNNAAAALASQYNVGVDAVDPLVGFGLSGGVDYMGITVLEVAEDSGGEPGGVEGGSATSVEVVAVGAGSKAASAGSASDVDVYAAGAGSKTAQAGSALSVDVTVSGAGAKHASGGSASSVAIIAAGAGTAEETASGGSAVTVSIAATGDGTKAAQGASPAGVDVSAQGAGSKAVSGGSGASVGIVATGGGTAAEGVSGGSVALVDVLATGGGAKATSGASGTSVEITTAQAGSKHASGGSASSLSVTATGGGTAEEVPPEGGSAVTVYVLTSGGGLKAVSLGSATLVSLVASGAGQKHASGGSAARVGVYTSAGGGQVLPFDVHPRNIIAGHGPGFVIAGHGPGFVIAGHGPGFVIADYGPGRKV